jgi:hypothetical protein
MAAFCSTRSTVVPWALISRTVSAIRAAIIGARPRVGSSSRSILGRAISARPMASICCSPPDSSPARCLARSASTGKSLSTSSLAPAADRRSRAPSAPARRFSSTVIRAKTRRPSGTWTTPPATTAEVAAPDNLVRSKLISPAVIPPRWNRSVPDTARSRVDFPAPLPPSTVTIEPRGTFSETPRRARTGP